MSKSGTKAIAYPSKKELRALWESGVPLDKAWVEFSDTLDDFKLAALRTGPREYQAILDDPRYAEVAPSLPETWEERQRELDIVTTVERSNLLYGIYVGELWAIGCQTLENGFDEIVRVPRELFFLDLDDGPFHEDIYWAKGQLMTDELSYFDIRIVRPPADSETTDSFGGSKHSSEDRSARPGRPRTKDKIRDLVEQLLKTDVEFQTLPNRMAQAEEVRARLCGEQARLAHDMEGFKSSTIKIIIGQVANRLNQSK